MKLYDLFILNIAYRLRKQNDQQIQRDWIKQQKREHQWNDENETRENKEYADQTEAMTRMRGMLEDEMSSKKNNQLKELQAYNKRQADEKKQRENNWKNNQENQNQSEISRTNMSDFMQEAAATTNSQLAPHRYVPYHFKGLRPEQVDSIKIERELQCTKNEQERTNQKDEEYAWAVQNLANTQH